MKQTIQHIYYFNLNGLTLNDPRLKDFISDFKDRYLSAFGDTVIVVPSINREGLETLPNLN